MNKKEFAFLAMCPKSLCRLLRIIVIGNLTAMWIHTSYVCKFYNNFMFVLVTDMGQLLEKK